MPWQESPYSILGILNAVIALGSALWALQRRPVRGVRTFAVIVMCLGAWSATDTFGRLSTSMAGKLFWAKASFLPAVTAPVAALTFVLRYDQPPKTPTRRQLALLAIEPFLTMLFLWTNGAHGWVWRSVAVDTARPFSPLLVSYGPWFWFHLAYSYLLLSATFGLLIRRLGQSSSLYRRQGLVVLFAGLASWVASIVSTAFPHLGQSAIGLGIGLANGLIVWNLARWRLFELLPVARAAVLEQLDASVIVLDDQNRIVDLNRSAQKLIGRKASQVLGKTTSQVFVDYPQLLERWEKHLEAHEEIQWGQGDAQRWFDLRMSPLRNLEGDVAGRLVVLHEITEGKRSQVTLRRQTEELGALQRTILDITAPHDLPTLLQAIVERAAQLLDTPSGGMYLCDPAAQEVLCVVSYKTPQDYTGTVLRYGEGAAGMVAQTGEPSIIDDYRTWGQRAAAFEMDQPFTAVLSVPMVWQGQVTGVIHVLDTEERRFTDDDLELLSLFASHAAIAVENARLFDSLQAELSERRRLEGEIETRRLYLESVLASAPDAIVTLDSQHRIAEWNRGAERLFGYTAEEVRGRDLDELITGKHAQTYAEATSLTRRVLAGEAIAPTEVVRHRKDGSPVHVILAGSPILSGPELLGVVATYMDIGELKRAEEALGHSEARYRSLFEDSPIALWEEDWSQVKAYVDGLRSEGVDDLRSYLESHLEELAHFPTWVRVLEVNRVSLELYKATSKEELVSGLGRVLVPEAVPGFVDSLLAIAEGRTSFEHEQANQTLEGERKLIQVRVQVMPGYEDTWSEVLVSLVDITEREQAKADLQESLREKEMLLREVHHRVKNTLQIVSSLLYLQSEKAEQVGAGDILQSSRDQVRSMALVHERLYSSEDLARVDFGEYLHSLRTSLLQTYGGASRGIDVQVDADAALLDIDLATPCGLIVNELVSNALKYAFNDQDRGEVGIGFYADGEQFVLTVHDNGIGLPEEADLQDAQSLGLTLVHSLVEQLHGTMRIDRGTGSRFTIVFPAARSKGSEGATS